MSTSSDEYGGIYYLKQMMFIRGRLVTIGINSFCKAFNSKMNQWYTFTSKWAYLIVFSIMIQNVEKLSRPVWINNIIKKFW